MKIDVKLTIWATIDLDGTPDEMIRENFEAIAEHAAADGLFTDSTPATADCWTSHVAVIPHQEVKTKHTFEVQVNGCTKEQAERVLAERLGHDEDYGFEYTLNW